MSLREHHVLRHQLPAIEQIVRDETWLEGERRGCFVDARDPVVLARVCDVVLRVGGELRSRAQAELDRGAILPAMPVGRRRC